MQEARRDRILTEAESVEKAAWLSAESHITAAGFWSTFQIFWGSAAAVTAAVAAGSAFAEHTIVAGAFAIAATASAAVMTSLQPNERTAAHLSYAGQYHALQYSVHLLRRLEAESLSEDELVARFSEIADSHRELNRVSPHIPRRLIRRSADFIRDREAYFRSFGLDVRADLPAARRRFVRGLFSRSVPERGAGERSEPSEQASTRTSE